MKKFTCREMGGPCDVVIEGETMEEVAQKGGQHVTDTKDDAHTKLAGDMEGEGSEEKKQKWMGWFKGKWDEKEES
jgi:predicted small metal-binding protein